MVNFEPVIPNNLDELDKEARIQLALAEVRRSGLRENGNPVYSLRQAAQTFNIPPTTLTDRYKGGVTRLQAHEHELAVSKTKEETLVEWMKVMGRRGIPMSAQTLREHASLLAGREVGESWVPRFKLRHPNLKVRWTTALERARAQALNPTLVSEFYDGLMELLRDFNIKPENIYNMDEKGIQLGVGRKQKVFVDRDQKDVYAIEDGNRELVTVIECICADGTVLPPSVIFQAIRRELEWARSNPCNAR
jgi:hypothetical protein